MSAAAAERVNPEAAPAVKRGKKKLIVIGVVVLIVLLLAGAGVVWWLKHRAHAAELAAELAAGDDEGGKAPTVAKIDVTKLPIFLPLDPFIVNLADRDVDRFAQIGITLELENAAFSEQIKGYMPAVRNAILMVLASKSSRDLIDRPGKEQLAEEIMREAVRPMGIETAPPRPVTVLPVVVKGQEVEAHAGSEAPAASGPAPLASGAAIATATRAAALAPAPAKSKPRAPTQKNPIQHVHFSSFIIQ